MISLSTITGNFSTYNSKGNILIILVRLWDVMDEIVQLSDCDVYTYNPDVDDDPMNEEEGYL